jgi:hypothetical protein
MTNRAVIYFRKDKALKIWERPMEADLKTLLSATLAISRNRVVKKHITNTLQELNTNYYKMSA